VIGGTLKKLRDDARDASLSPDGSQIVFRDAVTRDVWLMGSDGQQARLLVKPEEGYLLFKPTWFANGRRIAYGNWRIADGPTSLVLESRDTKGGDPVRLVSNPRLIDFCWGQPGRLIYTVGEPPPNQYESNLLELRFDPDTGSPRGSPRRLTDWTGFSFSNPEITADGKRLVFLNDHWQSDVYLGELANGGTELKPLQRLTLDERLDWPGGWSLDGKTVLLYSDRNRNFDIYKQGPGDRNAEPIVAGSQEKRAPQISPDGKWVVYMEWPKVAEGGALTSGKLMRAPVGGGPPETIMEIKGHPGAPDSAFVEETVGGFPSFRCPTHAAAACVLAEADDKQVVFTAFDPAQGRKNELAKVQTNPHHTSWDLSPDGTRVALSEYDFKAGDIQVITLAGGASQKLSVTPWAQLAGVAWTADGKALFMASFSSRGTTILRTGLDGHAKVLLKSSWDIPSVVPSPDGRYLALGVMIANANVWTVPSFPAK